MKSPKQLYNFWVGPSEKKNRGKTCPFNILFYAFLSTFYMRIKSQAHIAALVIESLIHSSYKSYIPVTSVYRMYCVLTKSGLYEVSLYPLSILGPGLNLFLRKFNMKLGPFKLDAYTAPGVSSDLSKLLVSIGCVQKPGMDKHPIHCLTLHAGYVVDQHPIQWVTGIP